MNTELNTQSEALTWTVDEAAKILRLSRNAMYDAIANKDIPSIRIGRRILVSKLALTKLLAGEVVA